MKHQIIDNIENWIESHPNDSLGHYLHKIGLEMIHDDRRKYEDDMKKWYEDNVIGRYFYYETGIVKHYFKVNYIKYTDYSDPLFYASSIKITDNLDIKYIEVDSFSDNPHVYFKNPYVLSKYSRGYDIKEMTEEDYINVMNKISKAFDLFREVEIS